MEQGTRIATRDWLAIFGLGAAFGTSFLFNEVLLREIGPLTISLARAALGGLAVWMLIWLRKTPVRVQPADLAHGAVFGVFMFATPLAAYPLSQQWITGGLAGIVNAMTPLAVVVISHFWAGGERATTFKVVGVLCGLLGIVILSAPGLVLPGSGQSLGILLALLGPLSYAIALNYIRKLAALEISIVIAVAMTAASLLLLPLVLIVEGVPRIVEPISWVSLAVIGPVLTGWMFLTALTIMRRVGATASSTLTFISPISALLLGAALLNEAVGPIHIAGMAAIFVGLFFIDGRFIRRWGTDKNSQPTG